MRISPKGIALIKRFEGYSSSIYLDAAGLPTIGYGHLLHAHELPRYAGGIDESEATKLLAQDTTVAQIAVATLIRRMLAQHQFDALVSFTFNLGSGCLQRSSLRRVINAGEDDEVARQWMRFVWAGGRKLPGLVARRAAELALFKQQTATCRG